jgi:hypothetical protein
MAIAWSGKASGEQASDTASYTSPVKRSVLTGLPGKRHMDATRVLDSNILIVEYAFFITAITHHAVNLPTCS